MSFGFIGRWAAAAVVSIALVACGSEARGDAASASGTSKSATIRAWTTVEKLITGPSDKATSTRRVVVQVRPHCVDGSHTLDCEGLYTFAAWYQPAAGKVKHPRCVEQDVSAWQFTGGDVNSVVCTITSTSFSLKAASQVGTTPNPPPPIITPPPVAIDVTVDKTGTQRYEWTSRDGAHCKGTIPRGGPAKRTACTWS